MARKRSMKDQAKLDSKVASAKALLKGKDGMPKSAIRKKLGLTDYMFSVVMDKARCHATHVGKGAKWKC